MLGCERQEGHEGEQIGVELEDGRYFLGDVADVIDDGDWLLNIRFDMSSVPLWVLGCLETICGEQGWLVNAPRHAIHVGHYA